LYRVRSNGYPDYVDLGNPQELQFGSDTDFTISLRIKTSMSGEGRLIDNKEASDGCPPEKLYPEAIWNKNCSSSQITNQANGRKGQRRGFLPHTGCRVSSQYSVNHENSFTDLRSYADIPVMQTSEYRNGNEFTWA